MMEKALKTTVPFLFLILMLATYGQETPYEQSLFQETATYPEVISYYKNLSQNYNQAKLITYGETDFGEPLHVFVLSKEGDFDPKSIRTKNKRVLLINNGIHPGEPEGVDATMMLSRDLLEKQALPDNLVICIIPLYNIGGSINRSSTSRANQNGPLEYGFRGNSKNYDLNRDFIKTDSKNSASFQEIFNLWRPEILIDNHTSNGADYQHVMTLIPTQKDKLHKLLSNYLTNQMLPDIYKRMKEHGYPLVPYVQSLGETPSEGIIGFFESPRYSTGYASLHNTIGFMPETHMLKSYKKRVDATYALMQSFIDIIERDAETIGKNKSVADQQIATKNVFPITWELDTSVVDHILFRGYTGKHKTSAVSGQNRLYYDRNEPYEKIIPVLNTFRPRIKIEKPQAYIIPKAWQRVVNLLALNGVKIDTLKSDTTLFVESYYIDTFETRRTPYEGHYLHSDVEVNTVKQDLHYYSGDFIVFTNQPSNRYILETLEPQATDSFFNWNFFDSILDQKEHFSPYIFEDTAAALLRTHPDLRKRLEAKKNSDAEFAENGYAQLNYIYRNSDYYEKTHNRYPISRLIAQ